MRTRTALALLGVTALAASLVGCSGSGGSGASGGTVHLVFRQFDPADEVAGLQKAVDAWNQKNPGIQVDMQTLSPNNVQQFAREANNGSGPDVAQLAFADVAFLAKPKILTPLNSLLKSDPVSGGTDDLLAKDMTQFDGKTWALPWTADTMALVYRPDALKEAGISSPPTTWEELAKDATKISKDSDQKTAGFCFGASGAATASQWFAINYYIWDHGGELVQKNSSGAWEVGVSKSELTDAIDYFDGLFSSGATPKSFQSVNDYADPSISGGLSSGSCAMTYMPPLTFQGVADAAKGDVTTAPMPGGTKDGATHLGGRALGLNRNSEHPKEAWKFMKYLASATTFKTYDQYPASSATLEKLDVPKDQQGFVEQLPHARSFARYIGSNLPVASMEQLVNQQFSAVYSGQKSSGQAADDLIDGLKSGIGG